MSIEAIIFGALLMIGMYVFNKINEPKKLRDWAKKSCSDMRYGEILVHLSRIRAAHKEYGFLSDKEQALLNELESRERALKANSTPESILADIQHYALMQAPERAHEIIGKAKIASQEEKTNGNHHSCTPIQEAPQKPHYQMVGGKWVEKT